MPRKTQVLIIHGGETFKSRKDYLQFLKHKRVELSEKKHWNSKYLDDKLGKNFQIIRPKMPNKYNAYYEDWQIWFKKYIPYLVNNCILIGYSLGGIFLAKYLSENKFPKKILSTYLIAAPFDNSFLTEDLVNGFKLKADLSLLEKNSPNLNLLFSANDPAVPVAHAEKYRKKLEHARIKIYQNKNGHFITPHFPELVRMIKNDVSK